MSMISQIIKNKKQNKSKTVCETKLWSIKAIIICAAKHLYENKNGIKYNKTKSLNNKKGERKKELKKELFGITIIFIKNNDKEIECTGGLLFCFLYVCVFFKYF